MVLILKLISTNGQALFSDKAIRFCILPRTCPLSISTRIPRELLAEDDWHVFEELVKVQDLMPTLPV